VQIRGDYKNKGPLVKRRFLQVLSPAAQAFSQGSGRRELADALSERVNPLTARVIVNRVWGQCFGRPLVATPSNFGSLGQRPTHPELLDDLAVRFMNAGWSLKWLHRELVLSATYRQSSQRDARQQSLDPANQYFARMNRRRLSVEAWRDSLLAIADRLDLRIGGPSIHPQDPGERRRTFYSEVSRLELDKLLAMFDFPDPNVHCEQRNETTTPLQKLFMLNSPFMVRQAETLAERWTAASDDDAARMAAAYRDVFCRSPEPDELRWGLAFLAGCGDNDATRWTQLAQVLLASNELLMLD
jgi:hypothetical protein